MKYGDTLRQRSIPAWGHYNIDYDYLKDLIKHQTTQGTAKAVSIPGQGHTTEKAFGDTFYGVLKAQHDRINLFIRSKSGEIERRLEHIGRSLAQLQARQWPEASGGRLPARVVERYAKIDADVTKVGEEIRSLSRFQVAQWTGFRKILKKYKRWTRDNELERQFQGKVTDRPDSFYQLDLGYLLDQYIDVLAVLRAPFDATGAFPLTSDSSKPISRISDAVQNGTEVDIDLALSITPLGSRGGRATYWIHPESIVEVEVLVLQHMRLATGSANTTTPTPKGSPYATPISRKSSGTVDRYVGDGAAVGLLVLDHPEAFAIKQNASTIGSGEDSAGTLQVRAAGNARWAPSGEAAVVVDLQSAQGPQAGADLRTARLKRSHLQAFLDVSEPSDGTPGFTLSDQVSGATDDADAVRKWLVQHREKTPIACVCSKRTRFMGLHNNADGGIWAILDKDIFMKHSLHTDLGNDDWLEKACEGAIEFPHAILEVRQEGTCSSALVQTLDRSHLVERVRGFSMEAHAVWTCCKPDAMSAPLWTSLLDKDIRKLPAPVKRQRRKAASASGSFSHASPPATSGSATSLTEGQISPSIHNGESSTTSVLESLHAPSLQAFRKKRWSYAEQRSQPPINPVNETARYWNEYDNPESEDEGYYIYVDPNATMKFPGQDILEAWAAKAKKLFGIREASEESPQLSTAEMSSDDEETGDESAIGPATGYGTMAPRSTSQQHESYFSKLFRSFRNPHGDAEALNSIRRRSQNERRALLGEIRARQHKTEMTKLRFYSTCVIMAVVLNAILGSMTVTSRKKERGVVDSVVLLGTICSLLLCIIAAISMKTRRERLGWLHQGVVLLIVCGNVAVDVLLFMWAFNEL